MGDHRATISITFSMHGVESKCDGMWINWWPGAAAEGLPNSVTQFFQEAEQKSMAAFYEEQDKAEDGARKARRVIVDAARAKLTDEEWQAIKGNS